MKELKVSAIKQGTVIDHIPAQSLFKVISILELQKMDTQITIGYNFESKKLGQKGIIKLADKFPSQKDLNKIALFAPEAKINIIRNYKVVEKDLVQVPDTIEGIVKCMNPKCITNHESVKTKFTVIEKKKVTLKCKYCEKITDQEHFEMK
ncbi:MAG: aspartate carbamoyltransferase regulatory subunit [Bacteroidetes bacterium CG02_land_8_20_14_3_00_31_25]|nr:aspartate carbamoyltransferase regulatory subunit [Bacteroidota bacterium]PIV57864.1 MAG: aspartate carbamoyltransferase regulatory subunit [Bacteroidetes bacterium CG02_land_8_20_14_3_00_31_25]PIX33189.1 MAG: aspartate carbamoyltransferase regulatory subunit [Bacteroidetes bacterium CG_4_8_14_3_um_filter_31_14]PIY07457.1 MAG: aspartate carbamoyltransferase regulatory subunit [Bacteroidetes bacterium CG_4_10_14_3_um_filter_31_20]